MKRGRGRGTFIDSVLQAIDDFYASVMQNLKAWTATPPKLRQAEAEAVATEQQEAPSPALASTALSSQDGPAVDQPVTNSQPQQPLHPPEPETVPTDDTPIEPAAVN